MRFFYTGAERPSNLIALRSMGVDAFCVSYANALAHRTTIGTDPASVLSKWFEAGDMVIAESGMGRLSEDDALTRMEGYERFIADSGGLLSGVVENDSLPSEVMAERRDAFYAHLGIPHIRVTPDGSDLSQMLADMREGGGTMVTKKLLLALHNDNPDLAKVLRPLRDEGLMVHVRGTLRNIEVLRDTQPALVMNRAWLRPMMHGDIFWWDGEGLQNFKTSHPVRGEDGSLPDGFEESVLACGVEDVERVLRRESASITRLALWSFKKMEDHLNRFVPHTKYADHGAHVEHGDPETPDTSHSSVVSHVPLLGTPPPPPPAPQRRVLPVISLNSKTVLAEDDSPDAVKEIPVSASPQESVRLCNTCFVAATCPAFVKDSTCSFSLPVEVRTKDQLTSLLSTVIEMQTSRVMFGRFAEEMNGGMPDPGVSKEIDRLFRLIKQSKDIGEQREVVRMTVERQSSGGVLSAIFGERAAEAMAPPEPQPPIIRGEIEPT